MTDYYTPEELDAMPVGTVLEAQNGKKATKVKAGGWLYEPWKVPDDWCGWDARADDFPKPSYTLLTDDKTTYPTPTLGELVSLRESYRKDAERDGKKLGDNSDNAFDQAYRENLSESIDRLNHLDKLIDERIGL